MPTFAAIAAVAALTLGAANAEEVQPDCKKCLATTETALTAVVQGQQPDASTLTEIEAQCNQAISTDAQCYSKFVQLVSDKSKGILATTNGDSNEAMLEIRDAAAGGHRRCKKCAKETWGKKEWKECPDLIKQKRCGKEIEAKYSTLAFDSSSNYLLPTPTASLVQRGGPSHKLCMKCTNDNWDNEAQDKCPGVIFRRQCQKEFDEVYGYWPYDNAGEFIWQPEPTTDPKTVDKSDFFMPVTTVTVTAGASTASSTIRSVIKRNEAIGDVTTGFGSKSTSAARYGKVSLSTTTVTETEKIWITETVKKAECPTTTVPVITTSCTHWTVLPPPSTTEQKSGATVTIPGSKLSSVSSAQQKSSSTGPVSVYSGKSSSASSSKHGGYPTDYPAAYPHISRSQSSSSRAGYSASTPSGPSSGSETMPKQTRPASSAFSGSMTSGKTSPKASYPATQPADSSTTRNAPSTSASRGYSSSTNVAYSKSSSTVASESSKATTSATKVPSKQTDSVESGASKIGMAMGALVAALACMTFM